MFANFLLTCLLLLQDVTGNQPGKTTDKERAEAIASQTDELIATLETHLPKYELSLKAAKQGRIGKTSKIQITHSGSGDRATVQYFFPSKEAKETTITELTDKVKETKDHIKRLKSREELVFPDLEANSRVGDFGQFPNKSIPVIQIIGTERLLCILSKPTIQSSKRTTVMVYGVDTTGWVDGQSFDCDSVFEITGTETYGTDSGGSQTVFVLKPLDTAPIIELLKKPKK
jgi:hypothetical protein